MSRHDVPLRQTTTSCRVNSDAAAATHPSCKAGGPLTPRYLLRSRDRSTQTKPGRVCSIISRPCSRLRRRQQRPTASNSAVMSWAVSDTSSPRPLMGWDRIAGYETVDVSCMHPHQGVEYTTGAPMNQETSIIVVVIPDATLIIW